jgi:S1-C subfamily serine protease
MRLRDELVELAALLVNANARVDVLGNGLQESSGSAWLYADRLWVTNNHVVEDARGSVTLVNGSKRLVGKVIGVDADTDLAVIRAADSLDVKPLTLNVAPARLGALCFAVGAPLGEFADTMSMGIVSGLNRRLRVRAGRAIEDVIQTDAAINHGNSGGPLVDVRGAVLGVNTAGIDQASNIGFAVPAQTVAEIVPELIEQGRILRATIGAKIEIRASRTSDDLVVHRAAEGSALMQGDVLRVFDGRRIMRRSDLLRLLRKDVIDREIPIVVERGGKVQTVCVKPTARSI